ncbi:conserved protein, unknown function [Plasmodium knowlesi strain H]|uniref:Uncharacterized protein n=3 Tax=Plasmodium knowlesi TaxID=5850 RepID=A0A5K1UHQ9_PLAKH|nr:conserved protein, unknown function [Plasmodium knowlesi strain H]OTN65807.1 Uncharacterized protein PKNOH_S100045100 [Plasmodium knowlesi]CAA9987814.1 conserved protein, unknown function [Plasmodium knowlesi strain H]SBO22390.1 conserved protein, unknown function [Plasmodium knowlesi strain H]SBO29515.1 conserved protein, unknown function [Plasmodium knowlesi strain H]VVS77288.1 conserved protein, unknown function [Plasmodium knowlesi strain H]|eukprot:XP_002258811.1 hypothetical protein, conserved in Plasmodium species [Plasmodium knowlesi strain H]
MPICFSVHNLAGYNERFNTVLYREPIRTSKSHTSKYIIFFPGDYSNFFTNSIYTSFKLESTNECSDYCYSYEALFWVISPKYLYDHLIFIKPSIFINHFSSFSNFLNPSDISLSRHDHLNTGGINSGNEVVPAKSVKHLLSLLLSLDEQLSGGKEGHAASFNDTPQADYHVEMAHTGAHGWSGQKDELPPRSSLKRRLCLIGFSRGCSVLFALMREANEGHLLLPYVDSMYLLDPGFNKKIYDTEIESRDLEKVAQFGLKIFLHSTPQQVTNRNDVNIHSELLNFLKKLRQHGIGTFPYIHYIKNAKLVNHLNLHFEILVDFIDGVLEDPNECSSLSSSCREHGITVCRSKTSSKDFLFENWKKN